MRPLTLKMSAFGPYSGEEAIAFDKLKNTGLYLIAGDTGSGKTTIFDAISFALFGESSGGIRDASMLRSRFAEAKTKTVVELTFLYKGKEYRIKRNPEYLRPKDRGEGETPERADACLYMPDGNPITGVKAVNEKVRELLGVDKEQFSHIAMIAQGDFLRLLLSDTKKRSEIFREIFATSRYLKLQEELKKRSKKLHDECREISQSIRQYLKDVNCPGEHVSFAELEKMKREEEVARPNHLKAMLEELCRDLQGQVKELDNALQKTEKELSSCTERLGVYRLVKQTRENLEKERNKRDMLSLELEESEGLLREEENKEPRRKELTDQIAVKKEQLKEFEELDRLSKDQKEKEKQLKETEKQQKEEEKAAKKLEEEYQKGEEQKQSLGNPHARYARKEQEKEKYLHLGELFDACEKDRRQIGLLLKKETSEKENYKKAAETADRKLAIANELERAFLDGQAGILGRGLEEGKPCPVCGSLEHPKPALCHEAVPKEEEVKLAKKEAEEKRKAAAALSEKVKEISGERGAFEKRKKESEERLLKAWEAGMEAPYEEENVGKLIKEKCALAKSELEQAGIQVKAWEELEKRLPVLAGDLEEKKKHIQKLKEQAAKEAEGVRSFEVQIKKIKEKLDFAGKKEAEAFIKELVRTRDGMVSAYEKAREKRDKLQKKFNDSEAAIGTLEKSIKKSQKEMKEGDGERLLEHQEALKEEKKRCSQDKMQKEHMWNDNEKIRKNVTSQLDRLAKADAKWQMVKALCNTANGSVSGRDKITLETYVQMAYFDRIIHRANVHLMKMTDGRFELLRKKEAGSQKSQSGLELNVLDHYYMSRDRGSRSVKSLSGGESFLAALSLALGMSEEVSANAGGIETDALFVDEGFGTLDESALDHAIRALQELSADNRIVGIISHVPELKNRIERQIVVKRSKEKGSRTELVL